MPLTAKRPSQELVDIVVALRGTWNGYVAMWRCPAHADSDPSLSIRQGDRGILVTCFAGCCREAVLLELRRVRPGRHYAPPGKLSTAGKRPEDLGSGSRCARNARRTLSCTAPPPAASA